MTWVEGVPRLAYSSAGHGVPLVFMHGIGGNRSNWSEQVAHFAARYHAVAWDARGYGDSDDYATPLHFADFSADLHRLLDALGATAAHLVGLSMGGRIALDFYERAPQRVLSLTLADSFPGYDESFTPEAREKFIRLRKQPLLEGKTPRDIAPIVAKTLVSQTAVDAHVQRLVDSLAALHQESYIKAIEAMTRYEPVAALHDIRVPTLVVVGDEDRLTPPQIAREMAAKIPNARLAILRHAGHLSNIEQPRWFNRVLDEFLSELGEKRSPAARSTTAEQTLDQRDLELIR
ncbi:MAG: alpha/beta fold hydrolase [Gammaproteobacteria bacterium]